MKRFDLLMERWAERYSPIAHSESKKRFFRVHGVTSIDSFSEMMNGVDSAACGYVTHVEGVAHERNTEQVHTALFFSKRNPMAADDDVADIEAKAEALTNGLNFIAALRKVRDDARNQGYKCHPLYGVDLDDVQYDTAGPIGTEGWFMVSFYFGFLVGAAKFDPSLYTDDITGIIP